MDKRRLSLLAIICVANALIYTLPYLQSTYYDSMQAAYGFTHVQMGNLVGVFGACNIAAYFFGGVAADAFDTKKLFVFSMAATGLTGLYSATLPGYTSMLALSIFWSFSTILTFWPAMIKAVKNLADGAHQGQVFSFKETMCCIITFGFSMTGLALFNLTGENFVTLAVFYSVCHIIVAGLVYVFMPSGSETVQPDVKSLVGGMGKVLKLKGVWLIGFTIFFSQLLSIIFGRFTPFLTGICGMSASTVALITIIGVNGFANIGSIAGGRVADAIGSPSKFISFVMVICALTAAVFLAIPWGAQTAALCTAFCIVFRILNGALKSVLFATMSQVDIPPRLTGTSSGFISIIGYLPDAFAYTLCGSVMEAFPGKDAYIIIFSAMVVCALAGAAVAYILHRYSAKLKYGKI